jgi:hypothetical protein
LRRIGASGNGRTWIGRDRREDEWQSQQPGQSKDGCKG